MAMPEKKFRLSDMELDEVSLVISGDDPSAKVVLAKAEQESGQTQNHGGNPLTINKADLSPEVREYIDELEGSLTEAIDLIAADLSKDDDDIADGDEYLTYDGEEDEEETVEDDVMEKADPIVKARIEKLESDLQTALEMAATEQEMRLHKEALAEAEHYGAIGKADDIAEVLLDLDADQRAAVSKLLQTATQQIEKGALFAEFGRDSVSLGVSANVEARAAELRKTDTALTEEQAIAAALDSDPDAYELYLNEKGL